MQSETHLFTFSPRLQIAISAVDLEPKPMTMPSFTRRTSDSAAKRFRPEGAGPYSQDLKNLETRLLGTGHFAIETHGEGIASRIETFLTKNKIAR